MKNLLEMFLDIFYKSFLGELYLRFLLWIDSIKLKKRKKNYNITNNPVVLRDSLKIKYDESVGLIKKKIKELSESNTKEDLEKTLSNLDDLVKFAEKEQNEMIENLKEVYVYKEKDIKTDTDKAKMLEKRINHYEQLKKGKEKRELNKAIRLATRKGDTGRVEKLTQEWKVKYGKSKSKL